MRVANISTIEEANAFLPSFLEKYNNKFSCVPASSFNAHRPLSSKQDLKYILCTKEERTIQRNAEVQFNNEIYQLTLPKGCQRRFHRTKINVITTLDNELHFEKDGVFLKTKKYSETLYVQVKESCQWPEKGPRGKSRSPWHQDKKSVKERRLSAKAKKESDARLQKRREQNREENLEILAVSPSFN